MLSSQALRTATRRAQAEHQVSVPALLRCIERSNGHHGTGALRAVIADGPAPTRSKLENLLLDLLDGAGIERPEVNAPLRFGTTRIVPDYLWRERRVAVEPTANAGTSRSSSASTTQTSRRSSRRARPRRAGYTMTPARSDPSPVSERTFSSANSCSLPRSVDSTVPSQQPRKPSGIEMMPGLARS